MVKIKKSTDKIIDSARKKKKCPGVKPALLRILESLREVIEKEIKKVVDVEEKKKPKKQKNLEDIADKSSKVKRFIEKEDINYLRSASFYNVVPQLDYGKLFSYLGQMRTQQSLYGAYSSNESSIKPWLDDGIDYKAVERIIRNKKIATIFGNYTRDGSIGTDMSPDASVSQREKWNLMSRTSSSWALSTCMYDIVLG